MDTLCVDGDDMTTMMMETMMAGDVWQGALEKIQTHISSQTFETWFRSLGPLEFDGSSLVLEVPSQFYVDWLDHHYRTLIESSLAATAGHPVALSFQVRSVEAPVFEERFDHVRSRIMHKQRDFLICGRRGLFRPLVLGIAHA